MSFDVFVLLHVLFAVAWVLGYEQRARRAHTALVEDRAARLERELGYLAREAVADERVRRTRELHQTITNNVSMMVARAQAVARALPPAAEGSRDVLGFILKTGEQTLSELRRGTELLSLTDPLLAPAEAAAAMSQLSALVTEVKMAGLPIDVTVEGDAVPLPAEVDGSAYRIVQEALTTCFKRPGSARPQVVIRYHADDLELRVTDEPGSGWEVVPDSGRYENLGWMQRREPEPEGLLEGGYGVLARLPLGSVRS
jgi:signal transduction histidine kinase